MPVKITVGPPVLTINRGSNFMVTDYGGEIDPTEAQGVFADDTRFVCCYRLAINGERGQRVSSAPVSYHSARLYLINPRLPGFAGTVSTPAGQLGLRLLRSVDDGVHEIFEITNYGLKPKSFVLE